MSLETSFLGGLARSKIQMARAALAPGSEAVSAALTCAGFCSAFELMQCNGT